MSTSRKRDGRRLTDAEVEAADSWHWVSIGEACAKLLERLIEHHGKQTTPAAKQGLSGDGSGELARRLRTTALAGSTPAAPATSTRASPRQEITPS
jgi:hypothetical protein